MSKNSEMGSGWRSQKTRSFLLNLTAHPCQHTYGGVSGYRLRVFNPDPKRVRLLQDEEGVVVVKSVTQVASPSGVVLSPVLENGIHLSLSTISPEWAAQRYHVVGKGAPIFQGPS